MERGLRVKRAPTIHPSDYNGLGGIGSLLAGIGSGVISAYGGNAPDYMTAGYLSKQEQNNAMYDLQQARNHDANAARVNEFMTGIASPNEQDRQAAAMNNPDLYNVYAQMQPQKNTFKTESYDGKLFQNEYDPQGQLVNSQLITGTPQADAVQAQWNADHQPKPMAPNSPWKSAGGGLLFNSQTGEFKRANGMSQQGENQGEFRYNRFEDLQPNSATYKRFDKIDTDLMKQSDAFQELQGQVDGVLSVLKQGASQYDVQSALIRFSKINDPGSVVRESEFATTINNSGVTQKIGNYIEQLQRGMALRPGQINDLRNTVIKLHASAAKTYQTRYKNVTTDFSKKSGVNPDLFIPQVQIANFGGNENPAGKNDNGGYPQPSQAAIEALYKNPSMWQQFEAKYGAVPTGFKKP